MAAPFNCKTIAIPSMLGKLFFFAYCAAILGCFYVDSVSFTATKQIGVASSLLLALVGNATALNSIFSTVPATSVLFPRIAKHSFLGVIMCELNTLLGFGFSWLLVHKSIDGDSARLYNLLLGCSGVIVGFATYYSSVSIGMMCAAISVVDGKDPEAFSKLVMLELIPTITGVLGFVVGIFLTFKAESLFKA